jgi:hypothetical protein
MMTMTTAKITSIVIRQLQPLGYEPELELELELAEWS